MAMKRYTPEELQQVLADHKKWLNDEEGGVRANLVRANLDGANLARANLVRANLAGANLDGAYLAGANLDGAYLDGAYLAGAYLDGAYLDGANLAGANLAGANLVRANLDGAYLDGAYLAGAYLDGAYLDGANLAGANLAGANLVRANLAGANLDGAYLDGAYLAGAYLVRARGFQPFLCIGPIGSRRGYTTVYLTQDRVRCGCFNGTLAEFEKQVQRTHKTNPLHLAEYTALIAMAKTVREAQPPREETPATAPAYQEGQEVRLNEAALERWPWAPKDAGRVMTCGDGWARIDFPERYLSAPEAFLQLVEAEKDGAA